MGRRKATERRREGVEAGYAVEAPDEAALDIVYAIDPGDARVDDNGDLVPSVHDRIC
jgi:hypothetical protein